MYRVNTLPRKVLITVDEVISMTNTSHTLDRRTIEPAIIIAEERIVRPALGFNFYEHLRELKNQIVTIANKVALEKLVNDSIKDALPAGETFDKVILEIGSYVNASIYLNSEDLLLWNEYLWKLTAEAVRFIALPQNYVQFTSQGLIHNNPVAIGLDGEKTTTPELRTTKWLMDKAMHDVIDPLIEAMHEWLCIQKKNDSSSKVVENRKKVRTMHDENRRHQYRLRSFIKCRKAMVYHRGRFTA